MAAASPTADIAPKKPKKGLMLAVAGALVLVLAAAGGGAAWYFMQGKEDPKAEGKKDGAKGDAKGDAKADPKAAKAKSGKPPVFVPMDVFTVNLQGPSRDQYLQLGLVLEVADGPASDAVKQQMPVIRGQILLLLAGKSAEELAKPDGKDRLAEQVLQKVRQPLPSSPPLAGVEAVHYSAFIVQ
jgi:flagellar FliL protein